MSNACPVCDFDLFNPVAELPNSFVGLYDDGRFPGRCIVRLKEHIELLEEVPLELAVDFMLDVQSVTRTIRAATGVKQVDVAILGNAEPHVHAHLIPRYPDVEEFPTKTPWHDKRPRGGMEPEQKRLVLAALMANI